MKTHRRLAANTKRFSARRRDVTSPSFAATLNFKKAVFHPRNAELGIELITNYVEYGFAAAIGMREFDGLKFGLIGDPLDR